MNLRLELAYDGTGFHGWARQPGLRTVEGALVHALTAVYGSAGRVHVAGRTDTGVHALGQVASVEVDGGPPPDSAARALNAALPADVAVRTAMAAPAGFHARHSARARSYVYRVRIAESRSPFNAGRVLHHPDRLDLALLDRHARLVVGTHDFRAFTPTDTQHTDFVRSVSRAEWWARGSERWFVIVADRFLRHMVRTLVGTMLQAAGGERMRSPFEDLLEGAPRVAGGPTAPPRGLHLTGVRFEGDPPCAELARIASQPGYAAPGSA